MAWRKRRPSRSSTYRGQPWPGAPCAAAPQRRVPRVPAGAQDRRDHLPFSVHCAYSRDPLRYRLVRFAGLLCFQAFEGLMLILLPPSEGKAFPGDGPPLSLDSLSLPELTPARESVLTALEEVSARPLAEARTVLGLSSRQAEALPRNRELRTAATLRAADLYTGVLYDRLRLGELLAGPAAARVDTSVLIFSALWGVLRPSDTVPPYRLSMGVSLPPLGPLGAFWRAHLTETLTAVARGRLVVDCRSTAYAAAFRPGPEIAEHTVAVRVLRQTVVDGVPRRSVVSHQAKAVRGAVAHSLLTAQETPQTPGELAILLADLGYQVELTSPARGGGPQTLNVIVSG